MTQIPSGAWKALIFFVVFILVDPLGLATTTSTSSQRLIYSAISLFTPQSLVENSTVVLLDDRSAPQINGDRGFPVTFEQHASILRNIVCSGPSALLIDITFRGIRSNAEPAEDGQIDKELEQLIHVLGRSTAEEIESCRRIGVPGALERKPVVLIARTRSTPESPCDPLYGDQLPETCTLGRQLDQLSSVAKPVSVEPLDADGGYALYIREKNGSLTVSPALGLLAARCQRFDAATRSRWAGCRDLDGFFERLRTNSAPKTIYPLWPYFRSQASLEDERQFKNDTSTCGKLQSDPETSTVEQLGLIAGGLWQTVLRLGANDDDRPLGKKLCSPVDTFSAIDVSTMPSNCGGADGGCVERLQRFFKDRMVVYGLDITGVHDLVSSPVHGYVPGASLHAIVAENLLHYGARHLQEPMILYAGVTWNHALDTASFLLALLIALSVDRAVTSRLIRTVIVAIAAVGWFALLLSFAHASLHSLSFQQVTAGVVALTLATSVSVYDWKSSGLPLRDYALRSWLVKIPVILAVLSSVAVLSFWWLRFPPMNVVGTLLIAGAVQDAVDYQVRPIG